METWLVAILDTFANCVTINIICLFGIVGNCLNITVLYKHGFNKSTNIILLALSISDLHFTILLPVTRLKCIVGHFNANLAETVDTFATVYFFMPKFVCLGSSFYYVALIAVERFVAVFYPFQVSKLFTKKRVLILVVCIFLISVGTISPTFFSFRYVWLFDPVSNQTLAHVTYTEFYVARHEFLDFYMWVGMNNFFCAVSMLIVFVCCLSICLKLVRVSVKRELMTSGAVGFDVKVVKMLVTVCSIYLSVAVPTITMYTYFKPNFIFVSPIHKLMNDVCDILYALNASVNFLVYVSMSQKFANTYRKLFRLGSR
ncbi:FMRFamide receptor-like [Physella acuta]|uniref:FMRFamide receptor-like n=1 Tax=Physella acuta TaxID=109671 RepID=UPI0027DC9DE4|nr:FMRFamide receptor-like [Physella acuta]